MDKYMGINESNKIADTELILNPDGSVYHLKLLPEQIADDIIVVGDPSRVERISSKFEKIEYKIHNREFITHTGTFNEKRITVIATGIGPDNIDIVINELDAAVNIDLKKRIIKDEKKSLNIVRIGTSGALQADIPVDSFVVSSHGLGFDGLMNFYKGWEYLNNEALTLDFIHQSGWSKDCAKPYIIPASIELTNKIGKGFYRGITATAPGFYGPQGRILRALPSMDGLNERLTSFSSNGHRITNFEMETSALFGLGQMLGHNTCTVCAIIANRLNKEYSKDYKKSVDQLIDLVLERLTNQC
jgi:uridine phosphorylase